VRCGLSTRAKTHASCRHQQHRTVYPPSKSSPTKNWSLLSTPTRLWKTPNHASEIAAGTRTAITDSNVEFIEKASGIKRRYVMNKSGVLRDPRRMRPVFKARPDAEISLMAETGVKACQDALQAAGKIRG